MMSKKHYFSCLVLLSFLGGFSSWSLQASANDGEGRSLDPNKMKIGSSTHYGSPYYYNVRYGKSRKLIGTVARPYKGSLNRIILSARAEKCMLEFPVTARIIDDSNLETVKCIEKKKKEKKKDKKKKKRKKWKSDLPSESNEIPTYPGAYPPPPAAYSTHKPDFTYPNPSPL